jgi:hypothetical protein
MVELEVILKVQPTGFPEGVELGYKRKNPEWF